MKQSGLELIVLRNAFYRDNYRTALIALVFVIILNMVLAAAIVYRYMNPPQPRYFAATAAGRIINAAPLNEPVYSDSYVLQWTANAVRETFRQDFVHWRAQLSQASNDFTPGGWHYFIRAMQASDNLKTLVAKKMVSSVTLTGSPTLVEKEVVGGHYAWKIEMPILVTYTNGTDTIPMPLDVTVIVLRMSVKDYPEGIAINNFLPQASKTLNQELM